MQSIKRRDFIRISTLAGLAFTTSSNPFKKRQLPRLSFSTLGCPDWSLEKIVNFAADNKFQGIELRGIQHELNLTKVPAFKTNENISSFLRFIEDKNIKIVNLGSSAAMHYPKGAARDKNMEEAKSFIRLAKQLNCPYIRVFPNNFPKDQDKAKTIDLIVSGLQELGDYAKVTGIDAVLMETHGDLVQSKEIEQVMQVVDHSYVGLAWDEVNMWSVTREPPALVFPRLKKYIRHVHIKDIQLIDGKEKYVLTGRGDAPVFETIDLLAKSDYKGYYSFEWEKLWHPELADPEIAIADYSKVMREYFKKVSSFNVECWIL